MPHTDSNRGVGSFMQPYFQIFSSIQPLIFVKMCIRDRVRATYQEYSEKFRHIALFFNQQVQDAAEDIRTPDQPGEAAVSRLVIESALIAGFSKILAEKLIRLCGADTQEVLAAEQVPQP